MTVTPVTDGLHALLQQYLESEVLREVLSFLQPFYKLAKKKRYDLVPKGELDPAAISSAISQATGKEVRRVLFISRACPFPPGRCETGLTVSLSRCLENSFGDSLQTSFGYLWREIEFRFTESFGKGDSLWRTLEDSLGNSLRDSHFGDIIQVSLLLEFGVSPTSNLSSSIHHFLASALAGKKEYVERLKPLMRLLPRCIPLGEKKDEPGVWLVLCA